MTAASRPRPDRAFRRDRLDHVREKARAQKQEKEKKEEKKRQPSSPLPFPKEEERQPPVPPSQSKKKEEEGRQPPVPPLPKQEEEEKKRPPSSSSSKKEEKRQPPVPPPPKKKPEEGRRQPSPPPPPKPTPVKPERPWPLWLTVAAIIALVALIAVAAWAGSRTGNSGFDQPPAPVAEKILSDRILSDRSLAQTAGERKKAAGFNDPVSFPFATTQDPQGAWEEAKTELLVNPALGLTYAQGVVRLLETDEPGLLKANPWLSEALETSSKGSVLTPWVEVEEGGDLNAALPLHNVMVNSAYVEFANKLVSFVDQNFTVGEVSCVRVNYRSCLNGATDNWQLGLREDERPFEGWVVRFQRRTKSDQSLAFGLDLFDKSFELFEEEKAEEGLTGSFIPRRSSPSPTPTPGKGRPSAPPAKDPYRDPVNQGSAPIGGGRNMSDENNDDGAGEFQPNRPSSSPTDSPAPSEGNSEGSHYETGSAASGGGTNLPEREGYDGVFGGTPPPTDPIPVTDDSPGDGEGGEFYMP